ncbi:hypothetical protein D3C72_1062110 [compost metagenome]
MVGRQAGVGEDRVGLELEELLAQLHDGGVLADGGRGHGLVGTHAHLAAQGLGAGGGFLAGGRGLAVLGFQVREALHRGAGFFREVDGAVGLLVVTQGALGVGELALGLLQLLVDELGGRGGLHAVGGAVLLDEGLSPRVGHLGRHERIAVLERNLDDVGALDVGHLGALQEVLR